MGANAYCGEEVEGRTLSEEFPIQSKRQSVRRIRRFD